MFKIPILLFIIGLMSIIQISIWQIFPKHIKHILFANPVLAFIINLAGSTFILAFTGTASLVGICNLGASIIFGIYAMWYRDANNLTGLKIGTRKLFGLLPIIPVLEARYDSTRNA